MIFNIMIIVGLELLGICCFCCGFIFGRYTNKHDEKKKESLWVVDNGMLDPITLQDQLLDEKLDKEARGHAQTEED